VVFIGLSQEALAAIRQVKTCNQGIIARWQVIQQGYAVPIFDRVARLPGRSRTTPQGRLAVGLSDAFALCVEQVEENVVIRRHRLPGTPVEKNRKNAAGISCRGQVGSVQNNGPGE
jgi:hypothetical protein